MNWTIIVAEDDPQSRYLLEQQLALSGHRVVAASDGRAALAAVRERKPDAVISDALMPGMDGFQFCHALKSDPALCNIPFIFYTATYTDSSDEEFALRVGADRFLLKPDQAAELEKALADLIAKARSGPPRQAIPPAPSAEFLEEHARRLSMKLEAKLGELQQANFDLRRSEQAVRALNDQLTQTVRRLEQEIAERSYTEEILRLAQKVSGVGSWGRDLMTDRGWWSSEACRLLGIREPGGSLKETVGRLVHRAEYERVLGTLSASEREHRDFDVEFRIVRGDGEERHIRIRSEVFKDDAGRPARRIGTIQDITEAHRIEAERLLLEARLRQAQKMEAVGNLAGGIAHDFNNILTAVMSHAELLELELPRFNAADHARESVQEIVSAANRARDLVKQILTFSRKQPADRKPIPLTPVVQEAIKLVRAAVPATIEICVELKAADRTVLANESQIHQILLNLCNNAVHAIGSRPGTITVSLSSAAADAAFAAQHPPLRPGPCAVLTVRDTGCGMDAETLARIYEPFFTTKGPGQGTGLGLAVAHGIVQSHDGAITVESTVGRGTTFQLWFPEVASGASAAGGRAAGSGLAAGGGQRVLFVDDEPSVAKIGVKLLERLGYTAEAMNDAVEARDRLMADPDQWDLVITDYLMPRLTGLDLAKAVWTVRPDLPMILAAGFGGQVDARRAKASGFRDFIAKPFALQTLASTCAAALKRG